MVHVYSTIVKQYGVFTFFLDLFCLAKESNMVLTSRLFFRIMFSAFTIYIQSLCTGMVVRLEIFSVDDGKRETMQLWLKCYT